MTPPPKRTFRPNLEALEERSLMASQVMANLSGGILTIWGTEAANNITVRQINNQISVDGIEIGSTSGKVAKVAASQVNQIKVYSYGGNDVIHLDSENVAGQQPITKPTLVNSGAGNDIIYGSAGNDTIYAGAGDDKVFAGAGNDIVYGEGGNDWIEGGDGNDQLNGNDGADRLYGNAGNDKLYGGAGNDYLDGGTGSDYFNGGTGFDTFKDDFALGTPIVNGAQSSDVIQQQSYTCQTLSALSAYANTGANLGSQIVYRGNNQFDVKLFRNGAWYWERVSFDGTWSDNDPAPSRGSDGRTLPETWVILFHRARLQQFGINWQTEMSKSQWDAANVRSGYRLYDPTDALRTFTGRSVLNNEVTRATPQALQAALAQKKAVVATTLGGTTAASAEILGWHAYAVTKVYQEGSTWKVQLHNPWGVDGLNTPKDGKNDGFISVTWSEFTRYFSRYSVA